LKPAQADSSQDSISKITRTKWTGGAPALQEQSPEFKLQSHQKKKKKSTGTFFPPLPVFTPFAISSVYSSMHAHTTFFQKDKLFQDKLHILWPFATNTSLCAAYREGFFSYITTAQI
jgi:hypothetical protein